MRPSSLSRSIAIGAAIAVCSAGLTVATAHADDPGNLTRDEVLTAANHARGSDPTQGAAFDNIRALLAKTCTTVTDGTEAIAMGYQVGALPADGAVDGLLLSTNVAVYNDAEHSTLTDIRPCAVAVLATTDSDFTMTGSITVTVAGASPQTITGTLSGGVFTSAPMRSSTTIIRLQTGSMTAAGNAVRMITVPTSTTVATAKTAKQKAAAKKTYDAKVKSAKKAYKKAVKKARKNKTRKAAAKKSYTTKLATYKASYRKAIAPTVRTVLGSRQQTAESVPFTLSATLT